MKASKLFSNLQRECDVQSTRHYTSDKSVRMYMGHNRSRGRRSDKSKEMLRVEFRVSDNIR